MNVVAIVIGRNEGERLRLCLSSIARQCDHIVYVDSGSRDGSAALARSLKVDVVELDSATPFCAARGRNEGFAFASRHYPPFEMVQFVDGDCELMQGWVERAVRELQQHPEAAAVFGRRREVLADRSLYARLCDIEWDGPLGENRSFGGDVLVRASVFRDEGGFNGSIIAGEEPELCVRIRRKGWKIYRIAAEMTVHDAQITRFGHWWMRMYRAGHAYAEGAWLHGLSPDRLWLRDCVSNWVWGLLMPLAAIFLLPVAPLASLAIILCLPLFWLRMYLGLRRSGLVPADARLYASACLVAKIPHVLGQLRFWVGNLGGRRSHIIEYRRT